MYKSCSLAKESTFLSLSPKKSNPNLSQSTRISIPNSTEILCSKCNTASLISLKIQRQTDSKGFNIKVLCKNGHEEIIPLTKFVMLNQRLYKKICSKCKQKTDVKKIYYCFKCKDYYCANCHCEHSNEKKYSSNYYGLLENRCSSHNYRIQEYYCLDCAKFLCKFCYKDHLEKHKNIINLMQKFDKYSQAIKDEIFKEKNIITKYNEILNSIRKMISKNIQQRKNMLEIKKNILNSYMNNNMNYFNISNIDFAKSRQDSIVNDKIKELIELKADFY